MEVKWRDFLEKQADSFYGMTNPTGGGELEFAIGKLKNGSFFFGIFLDMEDFPNDPFGDVFVYETVTAMQSNLISNGHNLDEDFTPEIVQELLNGFKDL